MFQALDLTKPKEQVAYYDDGVGTSSNKWLAAITGVFGIGLMRNVIDIYSFCCRNYNPDDRIYGFGFSRGAFTMRIVAGVIARVGLIEYSGDEKALAVQARAAYREYRRKFHTTFRVERPFRWLRDLFVTPLDKNKIVEVERIQFLGLWDTVDAYGGPIEEITRAIDYWYWPLSMPDRFMHFKYHRACHALAMEDERDAFRPVIWDERYVRGEDGKLHDIDEGWESGVPTDKLKPIDDKRLSQAWFVGVHVDIGGGYPQDGLSYVTLGWMMDRAEPYGLLFDPLQRIQLKSFVDPYDKLNDSRHGFAGYYRYRPRNIHEIYNAPPYKPSICRDIEYMRGELIGNVNTQKEVENELADGVKFVQPPPPTIHKSVFDRIEATLKRDPPPAFKVATDGYVPIVLPARYRVTDANGGLSRGNDPSDPEPPRIAQSELVWNLVWWRRIVYFLTMFATIVLAAAPLLSNPTLGADTPLVLLRPLIALAGALLPSLLAPWLAAYSAAPGYLVLWGLLVFLLVTLGTSLQLKIRNVMRAIWLKRAIKWGLADSIASIRTRSAYRVFFYWFKHEALPSLFALLFLWAIAAILCQFVFRFEDARGVYCVSVAGAPDPGTAPVPFTTSDMCKPTAIKVTKGEAYRVTITATSAWKYRGVETDPRGLGWGEMPLRMRLLGLRMYFGLPFRKEVFAKWLATVVRVGSKGGEEHVLELKPPTGPAKFYEASFTPRSDGEVFVFVNKTMWDYHQNDPDAGTATVKIEHLDPVR
jgi:hypothetical protein